MSNDLGITAKVFFVCILFCAANIRAVTGSEPEFVIAGLYINDEEQAGADLYLDSDEYWLPLDLLSDWVNVEIKRENNNTTIITPLGQADIVASDIRKMPEGPHVKMTALKDAGIHAHFEQNAYALILYAPWIGMEPQQAALVQRPQEPDFHPPEIGVARLYNRLDSSYNAGNNYAGLYSDALGHMANGVWGMQTHVTDQQDAQLNQLYWNTFNRYAAVRVGTSKANPGPLLDAPDFTGVQLGYSNLSIYNHLASNSSVTRQMFIDDASYSHDISGEGPKGGIAELRLNDRPIARVRIALDGRFLFNRLPITRGNTERVEVALYEYSLAQPPVRIINYTSASKPRAVSTGEVMLNAGFGAVGSNLEDSADSGDTAGYGSMRYGFSNFLTLEAATLQQSESENGWYLGLINSFGSHLATSIGTARTGDIENYGAELWGNWSSVTANFSGNKELDQLTDESTENQDLSARWQIDDSVSLLARGLVNRTDGTTTEKYLAPGFDWRITPRSSLSVLPIAEHDYDARYSLRSTLNDANLQLRASRHYYGAGINFAPNNAFNFGVDYAVHEDLNILSASANYRPRHNNDNIYSAQLSRQDDQLGYSLGWQYRISKGMQFSLSYYRQLIDDGALLESVSLDDNESLSLALESELWFSSRGWRADNTFIDSKRGAVSARLFNNNGEVLDDENIQLEIEGAPAALVSKEGGEKSIAGLPPGDYNLKLLADGLPIEYENNASNYRVRVAPAATTQVDITLLPHYGVSGQLTIDQQATAHTWVDIWQEGKRVAESKTDSYGYFQATGLLPGKYEIRHEGNRQSFEIVDDYLFDVNLASSTKNDAPKTSALIDSAPAKQTEETPVAAELSSTREESEQ